MKEIKFAGISFIVALVLGLAGYLLGPTVWAKGIAWQEGRAMYSREQAVIRCINRDTPLVTAMGAHEESWGLHIIISFIGTGDVQTVEVYRLVFRCALEDDTWQFLTVTDTWMEPVVVLDDMSPHVLGYVYGYMAVQREQVVETAETVDVEGFRAVIDNGILYGVIQYEYMLYDHAPLNPGLLNGNIDLAIKRWAEARVESEGG